MGKKGPMPPKIERVHELLEYKPEEGAFYWRGGVKGITPGKRAGFIDHLGYRVVQFDNRWHREHHLVWFMERGEWPKLLDHINRTKTDNRIGNLREADRRENARNSIPQKGCASKYKGVYWVKKCNWWGSRITVDGRKLYLGIYPTEEEAAKAYDDAALKHYGEFAAPNSEFCHG